VGVLTNLRNGNLPLLLKARLFPATAVADPVGNAVLFVVLFYSGASLAVSAAGALVRRATNRPPVAESADGREGEAPAEPLAPRAHQARQEPRPPAIRR